MSRKQCPKCPWRIDANPRDIPRGYSEEKHRALSATIAEPASLASLDVLNIMSCHDEHGAPCAGWLHHQLGVGNNIALRMAAASGRIDTRYELRGEQHPDLEATFLKPEEVDHE